ncbi:pyridoxal 5'-phosphate synthase glutaminase subunit PdxT [Candidatus Woesearchaeota archaeon]|nr:pyridoxal 5'-phosphate synthase glutaminase subunit PdxT [Candidatus Woesearchaeota archaeon]
MIGVLALQGAFREHIDVLRRLGEETIEVRTVGDLAAANALIIPGGESTVMMKLLGELHEGIIQRVREGMCAYGVCAGAILLAKEVKKNRFKPLGLIDIAVERNAYGAQNESSEGEIEWNGQTIDAVFIRAPRIVSAGKSVNVMAKRKGDIVLAQQNNVLVSTFHPELTPTTLVHQYFIQMQKFK